jgi:hypothetical protein
MLMNLSLLSDFFFWMMLINLGIYFLSALGLLLGRRIYVRMMLSFLGLEESETMRGSFGYLANFKLAIIFLNVTPWLVTLILRAV